MSTALCPAHPLVSAVGTCDRCGTFGCQDCLSFAKGGILRCRTCEGRAAVSLPSLEQRAGFAKVGLLATGAMDLALAAVSVGEPDEESFRSLVVALVALGFVGTYITTIVMYCRWFHLAVRHGNAYSISVGTSPAGAVGSWFIPFVNLARPFQVLRTLLEARGQDSSAVATWQAAWIIGNITSNIAGRLENDVFNLITSAIMMGAAFLAVGVVKATTDALTPATAANVASSLGRVTEG